MKKQLFLLLSILLLSINIFAQSALETKIPTDPKVTIGKLANGLTYYIRQNNKPEQKVELRLVINAGSALEDDNQQGLAHMTEHMLFNGTKNFKKNDIISFLQSIGVGFGNDLNAYTSFDETVYMLPIPTDKPGNLEKGFQILKEWAHEATFLNEDIDGEREVILEESRSRKGADDRILHQILPYIFNKSQYAYRLPIGIDSLIKHFPYENIKRFYKDWYRPNLMAVIVVGDITTAKAEEFIKKYFADIYNPANEKKRTIINIEPYATSFTKIITDDELTNYSVAIAYSPFKDEEPTTLGGYKQNIVKGLFTTMLNNRLRELTQQENPPYLGAGAGFSGNVRNYSQFNINVTVADAAKTLKGLNTALEVIEKVKRFGFTQSELDRAKANHLKSMELAYNERNKTESSSYVGEYLNNFLTHEPIPGIEKEEAWTKELIPTITLSDFKSINTLLQDNKEFFAYLTGLNKGTLPTEAEITQMIKSAANRTDITPYEEKQIAAKLLSKEPKAGKIIKTTTDSKLGTTTWALSNGTFVTIKKTNFKDDEVLLSASRNGGYSNYGVADIENAKNAVSIVNAMGAGNFSPLDLQKVLTGKAASAKATLGALNDGFSGSSSAKDVETMLQLLYLKATSPRVDSALYRSFIQKGKAEAQFIMANPQAVFIDSFYTVLFKRNPLAGSPFPTPDDYDQIHLNKVMDIYNQRFGNAYGMNFVIVGNFDEARLKPLVEKYIGGLPSKKTIFNYKDNGVRPVKGNTSFTVHKGKEEQSLLVSFISGETPFSDNLNLSAMAVAEVLNIRIIEEIREKVQGIYGGSIAIGLNKKPYNNYTAVLQLPTSPTKVDTVLKAFWNEVALLKNNGPSKENVEKVKKQWIESNKTSMQQNATWLNYIVSTQLEKKNIDRFLNYEKYINALSAKDIQNAANIIFNGKNVITAILMPEKN